MDYKFVLCGKNVLLTKCSFLKQVLFSPDVETKNPAKRPDQESDLQRIFLLHRIPDSNIFVLAQDSLERVYTVQLDTQVANFP